MFETVPELFSVLKEFFKFYNFEKPHQSLLGKSNKRFIGGENFTKRERE
jgi:hypothetical protein